MIKYISFFAVFLVGCSQTTENIPDELTKKSEKHTQSTPNQFNFSTPKPPTEIIFAGKPYSFSDEDIKERLDKELVVNTFWHSNTIFYIKRAHRWFPRISAILKQENVPDDFKYLAVIESGLKQSTSPSGAKGFWQFMPTTAIDYELEISNTVDERLHVEKSTRAACKYLKKAYAKFGSWELAAAAYNRGSNGLERDMEEQGVRHLFDTYLNNETSRYFFRILAVKEILENPEKYNFLITNKEKYATFKTFSISIKEDIDDLSSWAKKNGFNLKILKKLNPWLISKQLKVKKGKSYKILLPSREEKLKNYADY